MLINKFFGACKMVAYCASEAITSFNDRYDVCVSVDWFDVTVGGVDALPTNAVGIFAFGKLPTWTAQRAGVCQDRQGGWLACHLVTAPSLLCIPRVSSCQLHPQTLNIDSWYSIWFPF